MNVKRKAVLIAPANDFAGNVNVARFTTPLAPPLGILALGSYLAAHDVPVELIDVQIDFGFGLTRAAERLVAQRVAHYLRDQANTIAWVGISQLSNSGSGIALAQEIRAFLPDTPIVFGGYFPSSVYRLLLEEHPFITAIVRGDGEAAALQISHSLAQGRSFLSGQTPNLAWLDGNEIRTTPTRPMALDDLPILDFRFLRNSSCYQIIDLMTSQGCPFQCNYCLESTMRPYAEHRLDWVARQLAHLETELPNDWIYIYDPTFGLGRERTLELCRALRGRRFTYAVGSRVDVLSPDLIPALREAGIKVIYFGVESASVATLLRMNKVPSEAKARSYLRSAMKVLKACFENDVTPITSFMLSFPGDSETDYQASLVFAEKVSQLHDQVVARTGIETGFIPFAVYTKVYDGSPLAERVAKDFPETALRYGAFIGEKNVLSPSPGVDLDVAQRYQARITRQGAYTSLALERFRRYGAFSMEAFLAAHPELTDEQGITILGDSLRHCPQKFGVASMLLRHDKSKD